MKMKGWYKFLVILCGVSIVCSHYLHSSQQTVSKVDVSLRVTDPSTQTVTSHRTKRNADIPDKLHVTAEGKRFRKFFSLEMFKPEDKYFPVYLNGKLHTNSSFNRLQTHYYRCVNHDCLFHVEKIIAYNESLSLTTDHKLFGTFHEDGRLHILETTAHGRHVVSVPDVPLSVQYDNHKIRQCDNGQRKTTNTQKESRHKRATGIYKVELLMVVDYSAFQFWMKEKNNVYLEAIEAIKQFYAFMIKGVNLRYQNLPGATYSISILNAGLYILEDAASASFIENIKTCTQSGSRCKLDAQQTLSVFRTWTGTAVVPPNDHAMLFTRYDIGLNSATAPTGYAYTGKICSVQSFSLVEEDFNFISQTIAAHELAHSLSAVHDGIDNACSADQRNIMAAVSSAISGNLAQNPWKFSSCTTQEINNKLNALESSSNNCLKTTVSSNHQSLNSYLSINLGQSYSPDTQCKMVLGDASFACRNVYATAGSFGTICTGLWCNNPSLTDKCSLILPAERTSCGNQKWCEGYQCVTSLQAPAVSDDCVLGDQAGNVVNGLTCSTLISQQSMQCYNDVVRQRCCVSCEAAKIGISGCEYGDRLDCSQITSYGCYSNNNGVDCCKTCQLYKTTIPNCMYGDRSDCSALTHGSQCYGTNADICCQTCHQYKTQISGCEYGDRGRNCIRNFCTSYSEQNRNLCCETCNGVTTTTTSTTTTPQTTTNAKLSALPEWVMPVAAGAGGLLLIVVAIIIICCLLKSRRRNHNSRPTNTRIVEQPRCLVSHRTGRHAPPTIQMSRTVISQRPAQQSNRRPSGGRQYYINNGYSGY